MEFEWKIVTYTRDRDEGMSFWMLENMVENQLSWTFVASY